MKLSKTIKHRGALVVTEADVKNLDDYLSAVVGPVSYQLECDDGSELYPATLGDFLGYENPSFRRIVFIGIRAVGTDRSVFIKLRSSNFDTAVITMSFGNHSIAKSVEDEIQKRILILKPWHSILTRLNFALLFPLFCAFLMFGYWGISALKKISTGATEPPKPSQSPFTSNESVTILLLFFILLMAFGFIVDKFRGYFFPAMTVMIGRQIEEHRKKQSILNVIFVAIGLGVLSNILAAVLWHS